MFGCQHFRNHINPRNPQLIVCIAPPTVSIVLGGHSTGVTPPRGQRHPLQVPIHSHRSCSIYFCAIPQLTIHIGSPTIGLQRACFDATRVLAVRTRCNEGEGANGGGQGGAHGLRKKGVICCTYPQLTRAVGSKSIRIPTALQSNCKSTATRDGHPPVAAHHLPHVGQGVTFHGARPQLSILVVLPPTPHGTVISYSTQVTFA